MSRFSKQIENMTWSYSRISAYEDCPYRWFLQYISEEPQQDMFYASYGKLVHEILDQYYKGELDQEKMATVFLLRYLHDVKGVRPSSKISNKYIDLGYEYFKNFKPFPFTKVATELEITFTLEDIPFVGYIDYLGKEDEDFVIVDNKSRNLKPRSKRAKPTKCDLELDKYLVQLYLYSAGVEQRYGKLPKYLCFNCFKENVFIKEQFDMQKYEEAKRWAVDSIHKITEDEEFKANPEFFKCRWICGVNQECDYKDFI